MDLLGPIGEEAGDEAQAHRLGSLKPSRWKAPSLLLAWLPAVGDPLCALAGWLRMPFWQSVLYMAIGKFLRYLTMTTALLYIPDGFWRGLVNLF